MVLTSTVEFVDRRSAVFRSLKSALTIVTVAVTLGLTGGAAAADALPFHTDGGATGCCRVAV